ncbi:MAG: ribosome maturation factor RimP [Alphaproteobacteria bacterium]|nr:ribosome maturation factor RimP [Alphaproteobacteria bacterium]MDE2336952.1 ribosome maturation factor RimP [Alphaproteobacteria bacterium]
MSVNKKGGLQKSPPFCLGNFDTVNKPPLIRKIEDAITPAVESMGFELVRVLMTGAGKPTLQIMAERPWNAETKKGGTITIDECGKLSQAISAVLDVENVMEDKPYFLEVGSPGIDRPLTRLKDFDRFAGQDAKLEIEPAIGGRKRFRGTLKGTKGKSVIIAAEDGEAEIPFAAIEKAKLTVMDELLKPKQRSKQIKAN